MMRSLFLLASGAAVLLLAALPARSPEGEDAPASDAPKDPNRDAPHHVVLEVDHDDWLRAPGEDWFEARSDAGEDRFTWNEQACEITDGGQGTGEYEAGWVDAQGEFEFRYDEEEDDFAYWQHVSADTLTAGRRDFVQFCSSCHGLDGNGYGRSAQHLRPPPRDFTQATFKFAKVRVGQLPTDAALMRLIKRGLDGTPMYPWPLSETQLHDIVQYIKSLSPPEQGWRDVYAEIEDVIDIGEDPFAGRPQEAITKGEQVYHTIGCYNCHPGYVAPARLNEIRGVDPDTPYRDDLTYPKIVPDSVYQVQGYGVSILPPDFTWHAIRAGWTARDVAETVAAGIGGAGMPQWKGSIPDEDIWAVGHYIRHLIDEYKDQPAKRAAFMADLRAGQ